MVLSRYEGQKIFIGPDITLIVLEVYEDGMVKLGIQAPIEIQIVRDDAKRQEPRRRD